MEIMDFSKRPQTLEELAKIAGVSRSTISRVINNEPNVREAVRERVWKVVQETGYHPNAAARSLASKRSQTLGLVIPLPVTTVFSDPFYGNVIQGVAETAAQYEYHLMLSMVTRNTEEAFYRRALRSSILDGLVILAAPVDDPLLSRLAEDTIPFVVVGRHPDLPSISYVDTDNIRGSRMAVEHLIRHGRRKIGTVTGPLKNCAGLDRLEGYRNALRDAGIHVDEELIQEGDFTEASGYIGAQYLLAHHPDAVFVASDLMATGVLRAFNEAGVRVPDDIALVGFDDAPIAALTDPPLTTVRQQVYELGTAAVELLLHLKEDDSHGPLRTILPTELVIRRSSGITARSAQS